jgi:hypothetical protein
VADVGASVTPTSVYVRVNSNEEAGGTVSLGFSLDATCCVTYVIPVAEGLGTKVDWEVSFLPAYLKFARGKAIVPAGAHTVSLSVSGPVFGDILLEFSYELCDEDCDADGEIDWNQVSWGWSPDINGNWVPDECELRKGDLNLDGVVGSADLTLLLGAWGGTLPNIIDLTGDGVINSADLTFVLSNWNS